MAKQHAPRFLEIVNDAKKRVNECEVSDVKNWLEQKQEITIIDVREDNEFAKGSLPGALHIGKGVIERDIEKFVPNPSSKLVLYCGGGFRSVLAADALQKMGYLNVISMDGGWSGWLAAGHPTESR